MNYEDYCSFDATGLAELVSKREVSAKDLAQMAAEAVDKVNPELNAVIEVFSDRVAGLDESTIPDGPFKGVPFFLKDLGPRQKGRKQEGGSRLMKGYVADYSSFLTEQIERAGLNIIGRTTCPEFGVTGTTESTLTGATGNPWDVGKIAGGSSGGSAAITAAGVVPMSHSNDGGGSTRIPASICGNAGMKHSRGRISYAPEGCDLSFPLFSDAVNTHSVRDMAGFLDAVMGPAPGEAIPWAQPERPYVEEVNRDPGKLRIAMCSEQWGPIPIDKHISEQVRQVAKLLEDAGHFIEEAAPTIDYEAYLQVFKRIWVIDIAAMLDYEAELMGRKLSLDTIEPMTMRMYEAGKGATAAERLGISGFMSAISRQLGAFYENYDLLLTPVMVNDTPSLGSAFNLVQDGQTLDDWFENAYQLIPITPLNNFTGTPAVSLPLCEDSTGMPLGAHIMAPMGREDRLFNVSGQLERIAPWADRRPPLHVTSV